MTAAVASETTGGPSTTTPKERTKAKQRYLKAKNKRYKKRKATATVSGNGKAGDEKAKAADEGTDDESEHSEIETEIARVEIREEKRPKKRRKIEQDVEEDVAMTENSAGAEDETEEVERAAVLKRRSPTPPVALPSFPLPSKPHAPPKAVLALQGVDKSLLEAEVIDPSTTMAFSASEEDNKVQLSEKTRRRLHDLGISELFAVQTAVIPFLLMSSRLRSLYLPYEQPRDLCVSAPTGSGKTLAYVLPIVEVLSQRVITRLRALVVLPTRDLVIQVRETFETVAKGRGLKIATATGQQSFAHEQTQLVADKSTDLQGGSSKVDILICTPGRLMDHLNGTSNFSLQHLRFLVIDEADRLLAQSFQDWLAQVLAATRFPAFSKDLTLDDHSFPPNALPNVDALSPACLHLLDCVPHISTDIDEKKESSCQKLLFSATLTRDPAKISALNLHDPKYFVVQSQRRDTADLVEAGAMNLVMERFTMPAGLTEHMLVCSPSDKPLMLFHLVHNHGVANALIFTKSADSTSRLVRLFEFFQDAQVSKNAGGKRLIAKAYSSDLTPAERKTLLDKFKKQEIHILIASDLISRGVDISHVSHVVSYDAPMDMRKYVHRVGRTARAGRSGDAWTLVEEQEARYFKSILKSSEHLAKVKRLRATEEDLDMLRPLYEVALNKLKESYARPS